MTTVMSTISEATGIKPDDRTIADATLIAAKIRATTYCGAALAASSPELRKILNRHLQESLTESERTVELLTKKGWYNPHEPPSAMVAQVLDHAKPALS